MLHAAFFKRIAVRVEDRASIVLVDLDDLFQPLFGGIADQRQAGALDLAVKLDEFEMPWHFVTENFDHLPHLGDMPEKTAAEFTADGFFISGDLGKIDRDGYVHIVGRGKDLVISGGYNIYPKEVEGEIDQIEGVVESAVIGVPHPDFGEGVTAVVVRKPGAVLDEKAIVSALQDRLARYKQPKRIIFAEDLPRNTMGKVQKNILRQQYADLYTRT